MNEHVQEWASRFHNEYERLAPEYGYITRGDTRQFDPTSPNGELMMAVIESLGIVSRLNATERLLSILRDKLLITPGNDTICTWCGSNWAIGSPHEWHDEDCPLYANILEDK